jgi:isoleucyl-tRNA synthetase
MEAVQRVVSTGHALRKEQKVKVRQPLADATIVCADPKILQFLREQQHLIAEELNVKALHFEGNEGQYVKLEAKPNFRVLGKKVGKLMKAAQEAIQRFSAEQLETLRAGGTVEIVLEGEPVVLTKDDVDVARTVREGMVAATEANITIILNTVLTDALEIEGLAREMVNKINTMRREQGLSVTDRIHVKMETSPRVKQCYEVHGDYIRNEVLALAVHFEPCTGEKWDLNGEPAEIIINKAT